MKIIKEGKEGRINRGDKDMVCMWKMYSVYYSCSGGFAAEHEFMSWRDWWQYTPVLCYKIWTGFDENSEKLFLKIKSSCINVEDVFDRKKSKEKTVFHY